jgi:hypothetical protein
MIPGRSCGGCVVCCIVPPVKSPEFRKTSGVACDHCVRGAGCAIYDRRPQVCRDWMCGWRSLPFLDDRWRPDACGLLVVPEDEDIPPTFERRSGIGIIAFRSAKNLDEPFVFEMLAGLVYEKVPVFLSVPGPPGFHFAKALLNPLIEKAATDRDGEKIRSTVLILYERLARGPFELVEFS